MMAPAALLAQPAKEILKSPDWTKGTVITDGGAVYRGADFDSPVNEYLTYGAKVWILKRPTHGVGGMGLFHKVRYKNKSGFMADTDLRITGKQSDKKDGDKKSSGEPVEDIALGSKAWDKEEENQEKNLGPKPLYFTRYIGAALALIRYSEKFSGKTLSSQMPMFGLRMTGPGVLFDGPPLDVNLLFTTQTPDYYKRLSVKSAKGFLVFGDIMPIFPIMDTKRSLLYFGLGIMWVYPSYKVAIKNSHFDSQEFRIGAEVGFGALLKLGRSWGARLDAKYYHEKTQYLGFLTSVQTEF